MCKSVKQLGNVNIGNDDRDDIKIIITEDPLFKTSYTDLVLNKTDIVITLTVLLIITLCKIARKIILPDGETYVFITKTITKLNDIYD